MLNPNVKCGAPPAPKARGKGHISPAKSFPLITGGIRKEGTHHPQPAWVSCLPLGILLILCTSLYWEPWGFEAILGFGNLPLVRLCFMQEEQCGLRLL